MFVKVAFRNAVEESPGVRYHADSLYSTLKAQVPHALAEELESVTAVSQLGIAQSIPLANTPNAWSGNVVTKQFQQVQSDLMARAGLPERNAREASEIWAYGCGYGHVVLPPAGLQTPSGGPSASGTALNIGASGVNQAATRTAWVYWTTMGTLLGMAAALVFVRLSAKEASPMSNVPTPPVPVVTPSPTQTPRTQLTQNPLPAPPSFAKPILIPTPPVTPDLTKLSGPEPTPNSDRSVVSGPTPTPFTPDRAPKVITPHLAFLNDDIPDNTPTLTRNPSSSVEGSGAGKRTYRPKSDRKVSPQYTPTNPLISGYIPPHMYRKRSGDYSSSDPRISGYVPPGGRRP